MQLLVASVALGVVVVVGPAKSFEETIGKVLSGLILSLSSGAIDEWTGWRRYLRLSGH